MIKNISRIILLLFLFSVVILTGVCAYSNELFKFDLPSSYVELSYNNMYIYADSDNGDRGMIIYAEKDMRVKKSVWDIEERDIQRIINSSYMGNNVINTDRRAKLGKEKAIKMILEEDGNYIEMYILASNKYSYSVIFTGTTQSDLDNSDYAMIKKSFKLKDRTTNPIGIYILITIIVGGFGVYRKIKKSNTIYNNVQYTQSEPIDYKNMTEEDFKKIDE